MLRTSRDAEKVPTPLHACAHMHACMHACELLGLPVETLTGYGSVYFALLWQMWEIIQYRYLCLSHHKSTSRCLQRCKNWSLVLTRTATYRRWAHVGPSHFPEGWLGLRFLELFRIALLKFSLPLFRLWWAYVKSPLVSLWLKICCCTVASATVPSAWGSSRILW